MPSLIIISFCYNVIYWALKYERSAQTDDSLKTARAIFNNMGVALADGTVSEVFETLKTDNFCIKL